MLGSVRLIILLACIVQAPAKELVANHLADAQEKLDDQLFDRMLQASLLHDEDLEHTTLHKSLSQIWSGTTAQSSPSAASAKSPPVSPTKPRKSAGKKSKPGAAAATAASEAAAAAAEAAAAVTPRSPRPSAKTTKGKGKPSSGKTPRDSYKKASKGKKTARPKALSLSELSVIDVIGLPAALLASLLVGSGVTFAILRFSSSTAARSHSWMPKFR